MHRCFAEATRWESDRISLSPEESSHLVTVLRASPGDEASVFDGHGRVAPAEVVTASARAAQLRITGSVEQHPRPFPSITLIQAIPKGAHMDQIVEKATELGTATIRPVIAERTVRYPSETQPGRWSRIAIGAAKQCGTPWIPAIHPVQSLRHALPAVRAECDLLIVGSLEADSKPARQVLRDSLAARPARVGLLVGPEGDLTADEYRFAREAGAIPVSFGPLVLRVETAAIFGIGVVRYEFGT